MEDIDHLFSLRRRLDWLLPSWLENANAYSQSTDEDMMDVAYTIVVNLSIFIIFVAVSTVVRQYYPDMYAAKKFVAPDRTPPNIPNTTWFGWIKDIYYLDDDTLISKGGYDQFFFIRFYRLCLRILLYSSIYCVTVLIPINGTGGEGTTYNSFDRWSMTNVPQKSWKCWFHLIGIYIVTGITISALESEFIVYAKFRHEFLKQTKSHLRTVLVDGIPHKLRNPVVLRAYLDLLYPGAVKHIRLGINIKYLQRLVDERDDVLNKLERAMYAYYISHNRPKVRVGQMTHEVDAIVYYTQLLDSLNKNIEKEQHRVRQVADILPEDEEGKRSSQRKSVGSLDEFLRLTEIKLPKSRNDRQRSKSGAQRRRSSSRSHESVSSKDNEKLSRWLVDSDLPVIRSGTSGKSKKGSAKEVMNRDLNVQDEEDYQKMSYQYQPFQQPSSASSTLLPKSMLESDVEALDHLTIADGEEHNEGDVIVSPQHLWQRNRPPTHTPIFAYDAFRAVERDEEDDDEGVLVLGDEDEEDEDDAFHKTAFTWSQWIRRMWTSPTLSECWMVIKYGMYSDIDEEVVLQRHSGRSSSSASSQYSSVSGVQLASSSNLSRSDSLSSDHDHEDEDEEDSIGETTNLISSTQHDRRLFLSRAFVTFRTFTAATTAKQVIHMQLAGRLTMTEAPEPNDITWVNMYMTRRATWFRQYLVDALIILLIIVWVAPVTLLSYVFSYDAVTSAIPSLKVLAEKHAIVESMIDLLQPIVLVGIMNLLPPLLMALGVFEGSIALSVNQFRAYNRYFAFQIINVFLVNAIAGSVIDAITSVYDSPPTVFYMLGNSLPKMGGFFTNYILVKALTGLGMELIRVPALFMSLAKQWFTPNVTPRDRQQFFYGGMCRNVTNPGWFPFHKIYAQDMLLFVICATYSCVAPFILMAGIVYFFLASVIYKHQMIYIYEPMYETGGKWWPIMARGMVVALLFAQALLTGMFILKETYTELYFLLLLFAITLTYYFYAVSIYTPLAKHLPLDIAMALDAHHNSHHDESTDSGRRKSSSKSEKTTENKNSENGSSSSKKGLAKVDDKEKADDYLQPSVRAPAVYPEIEFLDREMTTKLTNAATSIM